MELAPTIRLGRAGHHWIAVTCIETPWGPVVLSAVGDERAIHAALKRLRAARQQDAGNDVQVGSLWGGLKKMARKIAKSGVVKAVASQVKAIAKNPIVATAIRLHTSALKLARGALKGITSNPLWNVAATGLSFIPGIGQGVSAGMAAAAALGRGASLKDAALAAVKGALPGGPLASAAFDVAMGVAHGDRIDKIALNTVRNQLPGGPLAKAAFDSGLQAIKTRSLKGIPAMMAKAAIEQAGKGPLWDKLATGAQIIPGLGTTASAGMAGAIAMGKRLGVKNMALSVARSALPGGAAMRAAFDAGIGIAQAGRLDASALQKVRDQLPRGEAVQAAFNTALAVARAKPGSFTGAFNALKSSLPSNEIGQQLARVAQQTLKRRGLTFDKSIAFKAAQEIAQRVRDGDQAARSRVMDLVQRAKQGDAAAQAATDMLRKIVETGPIAVASHGAVRMAEQAAQMAPALPALPPIPEPEELPGLDAQSTDQDTDPVDAQSSGEDGTDALIESMGGRGAARCPSCGHCASAAA